MTGLVYKEWKQNHRYILSMILCGFVPLIVMWIFHGKIRSISDDPWRFIGLIAGFIMAGALQMNVLRGDDHKLWGYWVSSTADGYKGFLQVKYEMIFGMAVLFLFTLQLVDKGYCAYLNDNGESGFAELGGIAFTLSFVQIFLRAIDIPFFYRFGSKRGSILKMIFMSFGALFIIIVFMAEPDAVSSAMEISHDMFTGEKSSLSTSVMIVSSPALYYLSYLITCRLYLKGVEQYDH